MNKSAWLLLFVMASSVWGQGRAPDDKPKKSESSAHPVKSAKDGANEALQNVDTGVHKAAATLKEGANDALNEVDKGVHRVVGSDKK